MSVSGVEQLFNWYREHVGEPDREVDLYVGFVLFFGGAAIALFALGVYGSTALTEIGSDLYWQLREIAFALGAVSLPTTLLGIIVLLPVDRRSIGAGLVGHAIILGVVWFFIQTYPHQWNVAGTGQQALWGMIAYAVGVLLLTATTAAALISYHIERTSDSPAGEGSDDDDVVEVTDEQVEQDIEEAMQGADLSWGGVYRDDSSPDLSLQETESTGGELRGDTEGNTKRTSTTAVSDNVAGLQAIKSEQDETAHEDSTQSQADALAELRRKQQDGEAPAPGDTHPIVRRARRARTVIADAATEYRAELSDRVCDVRRRLSEAIDADDDDYKTVEVDGDEDEDNDDDENVADDGDVESTEPDESDDSDSPDEQDASDDGDEGPSLDLDPDIDLDERAGTDLEETGVIGDDGDG